MGGLAAIPVLNLVFIARGHIKIYTCQVTFYLIVRLKALTGVTADSTSAYLAIGISRLIGFALILAKGEAPAAVVDKTVGRYHMDDITFHGGSLAEPALRDAMLTVVAVAFL